MSRLPDFLIIGAAKCGTTSLYGQLRQHPDIYCSEIKEPTFFSTYGVGAWQQGLAWYQALFADAGAQQLCGEASTSYSKAPWYGDAPEKIHRLIPHAKLIYMVRDPVAQIVSHHQHIHFDELDERTLDERLLQDDFLIKVACYAYQLQQYSAFFPQRQIHIIRLEDYIQNNAEVMEGLYQFLGARTQASRPNRENSRRQRQLLRWKWLKRLPYIHRMTPFERQRQLPAWLLRPQHKLTLPDHLESRLREVLAPEMAALKADWGVAMPNW